MTTKQKQTKPKTENIKINNAYFEKMSGEVFQGLIKKNGFEAVKPRYWVSKALAKIEGESKHYLKNKQDLVDKHAIKHEEDGERKDEKSKKVIQKWKKGDPIVLPNGSVQFEDGNVFLKELKELQEIKIDIKIPRVQFDEPPDVTIEEGMLLMPILEDKTEFTEKKEKKDE